MALIVNEQSVAGDPAGRGARRQPLLNATRVPGTAILLARLSLSGTGNVIDDAATLTLLGGGTAGVADQNFAILGAGINETVGGLVLGGVAQSTFGTYGSTTSGATFQNDEYFSGTGVVTLAPIPEPGSMALVGIAVASFGARLIRRKNVAIS